MTEIEVHTIKTKRWKHPNADKYFGRPTQELGWDMLVIHEELTDEQRELLSKGKLVYNQDAVAELFDSLQLDDVFGLLLYNGINEIGENPFNAAAAYKFKVLDLNVGEDLILVRNVTYEVPDGTHEGTVIELAFEDFTAGVLCGYAEILERDGKLYGVDNEIEIKLHLPKVEKTEEEEESYDRGGCECSTEAIYNSDALCGVCKGTDDE